MTKRECPGERDYYSRYNPGYHSNTDGKHYFEFCEGTRVELGRDAHYRCIYCGVERPVGERE